MTAGEAVLACLRNEGVTHVFGLVGHTFLAILDAFHDRTDIRFVGTRHEQAASFMADGYARATGQPGVCLAVAGAGTTNLLTGIAGARVANSPVIALAGGIPLSAHYKSTLQELDLVSIFKPVTKSAVTVNKAERLPELLQYAFRVAMSGRKGPVLVEIPQDVSTAPAVEVDLPAPQRYRVTQRQPGDPELVREAATLLKQARRPLLVVGGGATASDANEAVLRLAASLSIPMVTAYGQLDAVPNDHPLYVGPLGRAGAPEATQMCHETDLLVVVGSRLGYFETFFDDRIIRPGTPLVQIDVDDRYIGQIYPVAVGITGDTKRVVEDLLQALQQEEVNGSSEAWQRQARQRRQRRRERLEGEGSLNAVPVKPQRVYYDLRRVLPPEAIVVIDAGACPGYAYDRLEFTRPHTFIAPLDLGCIGWCFCVALGAKMGRPGAPVVSISGDGGYLMNAREMATAMQERIPVVSIVMNNGSWGSEKAYQREFYQGRYVGADIGNPRFDKQAEVFGARGYYVERPGDIGDAIKEALTLDVPSVIEIPVDPDELPTPAHSPRRRQQATTSR